MSQLLFPILVGIAFVLFGRWAYKNPTRMYPNWLYSDPYHPLLIGGVRVFGTMAIFVGSFAVISALTSHLSSELLEVVVALAGGILSAWFLRPDTPQPIAAEEMYSAPIPKKQGFLSRKGKWIVGISVVVAVLFFFGILMFIGSSEVCQLALQRAQSSSAVVERLGSPIKQGVFVSGSIETTGPSGHADVSIPISGPKAKGTLYAVGSKTAGEWKFETLRLAIEGGIGLICSIAAVQCPCRINQKALTIWLAEVSELLGLSAPIVN